MVVTFIKVKPNTDIADLEERITRLAAVNMKEELEQRGYIHTYFLQPIKKIYLHSNFDDEPLS